MYSSEWLPSKYLIQSGQQFTDDVVTLYRKASVKRSITNFIKIATGKEIPTKFPIADESYTDGDTITISGDITPEKIDSIIGLALHEASHIKFTNFPILKELSESANTPHGYESTKFYDTIKWVISPKFTMSWDIIKQIKDVLNWVEDRRIDGMMMNDYPGYKPYYYSLYDRYFHTKEIGNILKSDKFFKDETIESYMFMITASLHKDFDPTVLKGLPAIMKLLSKESILSLNTTIDALILAGKIFNIILTHSKGKQETVNSFDDVVKQLRAENNMDQATETKEMQNAADVLKEFVNGQVSYSSEDMVSAKENSLINSLANSDIEINGSGPDMYLHIKDIARAAESDPTLFEFFSMSRTKNIVAVEEGIRKGKLLGKKLEFRNSDSILKTVNQKNGKIDGRGLFKVLQGSDSVFFNETVDKPKSYNIHITIDGSSSMVGTPWERSITSAIAIAVAAKLTKNINVEITARIFDHKTYSSQLVEMYNSKKHDVRYIRRYMHGFQPNGATTDGPIFHYMQSYLKKNFDSNADNLFIVYSDGEPNVEFIEGRYKGVTAEDITRIKINEIKKIGYEVIAYFLTSEYAFGADESASIFKSIYGKSSSLINPTNMLEVAKSLNSRIINNK